MIWIPISVVSGYGDSPTRTRNYLLVQEGYQFWVASLHKLGQNSHLDLHKLAQKHGPIMHLRLGLVPTIVVSSPQAAELFLKTHDLVFASRPPHEAAKHISWEQRNLSFGEYGPYWRNMRKMCTLKLMKQVSGSLFLPSHSSPKLHSFVKLLTLILLRSPNFTWCGERGGEIDDELSFEKRITMRFDESICEAVKAIQSWPRIAILISFLSVSSFLSISIGEFDQFLLCFFTSSDFNRFIPILFSNSSDFISFFLLNSSFSLTHTTKFDEIRLLLWIQCSGEVTFPINE
ncbi:hypothetical protein PIB30_047429 [Stylosanthes scabra]|uniref:Cytochrome P450 n=1 Tax=Stylosanthes scabra TaxID=79078 RepID=A0ABU6UIW3_9FABA|nr:hypothetical protein [Stylosanthes scabra]